MLPADAVGAATGAVHGLPPPPVGAQARLVAGYSRALVEERTESTRIPFYFGTEFHMWIGGVDWLRGEEDPAKMVTTGIRSRLG